MLPFSHLRLDNAPIFKCENNKIFHSMGRRKYFLFSILRKNIIYSMFCAIVIITSLCH